MLTIVLSIVAILVSIVSFLLTILQNRKIHNENKTLQVKPNLCIELLFHSRIRGWMEKRNRNTGCKIDEINVHTTQYTPYYTHHDIRIDKSNKSLFTICMSNKGKGSADDIIVNCIRIKTDTYSQEYISDDILFSCSESEKKASQIYAELLPENVKEVQLQIRYKDILGKSYTEDFTFAPIDNMRAEMRMINHVRGQKA